MTSTAGHRSVSSVDLGDRSSRLLALLAPLLLCAVVGFFGSVYLIHPAGSLGRWALCAAITWAGSLVGCAPFGAILIRNWMHD